LRDNVELRADIGEKKRSILDEILRFGRSNRQLGTYLFIYYWYARYKNGVDFRRLWRFYNNIAGHIVHENTVRKQLKQLENKGLIEVKDNRVYPKVKDLDAIIDLFDFKRSKAGKRGAMKRLRKVLKLRTSPELEELDITRNLEYYVKRVLSIASKLVFEGKRWEALDLIAHTLLPIRETGVLWLWRRDEFIYYERKAKPSVRCVRFLALSEALKRLGFEEGIMVDHIKGHKYVKEIIHKLFAKGNLSWPWSRSVFYGLKKYELASEGSNYIIEFFYKNGLLKILLKDYYGNLLAIYEKEWQGRPPEPLANRNYYKVMAVGKQHIYEENESGYFDRW